MDVNEHERLSNSTLGHKLRAVLYLNLCPSVLLDSLSCSFISISFLTTSCSFTLICVQVYCWIVSRTTCSKKGYGCKWTWETIQQYTWTQIKVKEQLVVRNHVDVNEHERLFYIYTLSYYKLFLYFNLCSSLLLDSLSCSFTSTSFLTTSCSFTLICVQVYCWIVSHVHGTTCSKEWCGCKWTWETI
jgi:hypothetical protein